MLDAEWRHVFDTDELLLSYGDMGVPTTPPIVSHLLSAEARKFIREAAGAGASWKVRRAWFLEVGSYVLAGTPGGREELRRFVDPALADLVDQLEPQDLPPVFINRSDCNLSA